MSISHNQFPPMNSLLTQFIARLIPKKSWRQVERFDLSWKNRIRVMATFIPEGSTVMDLGCGPMWLKEFLPLGCSYIGVDYIPRCGNCIVADFNKGEFPNCKADVAFVSGCLEYIVQPDAFMSKISDAVPFCILSYCSLEYFPVISERRSRAWINDLTLPALTEIARQKGFGVKIVKQSSNSIFLLTKS